MILNYLRIAFRNLRRNAFFSVINIVGLALGISACFLIWQYVRFEKSYDTFNTNANRLYRVNLYEQHNGTLVNGMASNLPGLGGALKVDFPEVEDYCRLVKTSLFTSNLGKYVANALEFSAQNKTGQITTFTEDKVWFADGSFLRMFTFPLVEGTRDALNKPNSVVITESIAKKYFGNTPALGQELTLNHSMLFKVTGVIEDVPGNSHLQFDILLSLSTMRPQLGTFLDGWTWSVFYTYVELNKNANAEALQSKLPAFKIRNIGPDDSDYATRFTLQPITDIHLKSQLDNEQSPVGSERTVYFLSLLAIFILVVAWINYINLSSAKALERSKEVGLRKTIGAARSQLIGQFLVDTSVVNIIALFLAIGIISMAWAPFEMLNGKNITTILITGGMTPWLYAALIFLLGIVVSGLYPSLVLSSFQPARVLKGKFYQSGSGSKLRKLMIGFQYVLALLLIAGTITIYLQLRYMHTQDTGFTKDQVMVVDAPAVYDSIAGQRIASFENGVRALAGVANVTAASDVPGKLIVERSPIEPVNAKDNSEFIQTSITCIDSSFLSAFDISFVQGRLFEPNERMDFRRLDKNEDIPVLVNQEFVNELTPDNQKNVLNLRMTFWWGPDQRYARIVGVVSDYHQLSLQEPITPIMFVQPRWQAAKYFAVKLQGNHLDTSLDQLKILYGKAFPEEPFSFFFLDHHFNLQYNEDQRFQNIFNIFTGLAIVVTCLGLVGLSVFSVSQRTREVGIRKVLGASATAILTLFSRDFLRLLLIAYVIAAPVIYWAGDKWLNNFAYRIHLKWPIFLLPVLLLFALSMGMILAVSLKVVFETPVKALKQE